MDKFKIGDKVRIIDGVNKDNTGIDTDILMRMLNHNENVILYVGGGNVCVENAYIDDTYWFDEYQLELISENESTNESTNARGLRRKANVIDEYADNVNTSMLKNILTNKKVRGFEFISDNQRLKDFKEEYDKEINILQKLPQRGTSKSAGYDIYAPFDIILEPNQEIKVPTFLKAYMQDGEVLMAYPRSGLGFKYYCRLSNTVGIIDKDYYNNENNEGHIFVKLRNEGNKTMTIKQGEGMCQMIFQPFLLVDGDSFNNGYIRKGGFGSTTNK